jgi:hypothetical protein
MPNNSLSYSNIVGLDNKINKYDAYNSTIQKIEKDITTLSNFTTDQHTHNSINDNNINLLQSLYYQANTNIKNLTTSVSTNLTNININTSQILTNTSQISTNQSNISVIESSISGITNSGLGIIISKNIWSLTNTYLQFVNSSSYIAVPTINLRSITSNPPGKILFGSGTTNVQNFAYNDVERILCQSIPTIVNNVTTNTNDMINVNTNIGTLQSDINKIQGNILTNDNDIATLQVAVTANNNQISTLTSLQNNDLANFVAIDNNFTNIGQSISNINTKIATTGCAYRYYQSVPDLIGNFDANDLTFTQDIGLNVAFLDPSPKMVNNGVYKYDLQVQLLNFVSLDLIHITPEIWAGNTKIYQGITTREQSSTKGYSHFCINASPDMFKCTRDYTETISLRVTVILKATARSNAKIWFVFLGTIYKVN